MDVGIMANKNVVKPTSLFDIYSSFVKRELFKGFIRTMEKQDGITCEFDAGIWSSLVQEVIVKAKDDIRFIFKNGFEVKILR